MARKSLKGAENVVKRMKSEICSGGKVTVKPGQSRYEAQQEALNKPTKSAAIDSSPATTEGVSHVSES